MGRAVSRLRFISRVSLSMALASGCAGLLAAMAPPLLEPWHGASLPLRVLVQLSLGFGIGWWLGLAWGMVWAVRGRPVVDTTRETVPTRQIWRIAGVAASVALALRWGGVAPRWAALAALGAASLAAMLTPAQGG
jgi:hypothetical protein